MAWPAGEGDQQIVTEENLDAIPGAKLLQVMFILPRGHAVQHCLTQLNP